MSFDIVSLLTKIPVDRAVDIAHDRLLHDSTLEERTALSPDQITKLLAFCLKATFLKYKDNYYQQTFGTAMGSPVSVTVANLVMEDVEDRALTSYRSPPLFWKRYVDDVCAAVQEDDMQDFKAHINTIEQSINFTMEQESSGSLAYLDTEIVRCGDGTLTTQVFRK